MHSVVKTTIVSECTAMCSSACVVNQKREPPNRFTIGNTQSMRLFPLEINMSTFRPYKSPHFFAMRCKAIMQSKGSLVKNRGLTCHKVRRQTHVDCVQCVMSMWCNGQRGFVPWLICTRAYDLMHTYLRRVHV